MENKLAIVIVALMVAALAAPAAMAVIALNDVDYSATVTSGQSTSVTLSDGTFGSVVTGSDFADNIIEDSITCQNLGTDAATVDAAFTTNNGSGGTVYGLKHLTTTDMIGGSNFQLGVSTFDTLNDDGSDVTLADGVAASSTVGYDAKLKVLAGQPAGSYSGNVQLTFS